MFSSETDTILNNMSKVKKMLTDTKKKSTHIVKSIHSSPRSESKTFTLENYLKLITIKRFTVYITSK